MMRRIDWDRGSNAGWATFLTGTAIQAVAGMAGGGSGALLGGSIGLAAIAVAALRPGWAALLGGYWLMVAATSLPDHGSAAALTAWVTSSEAVVLAVAALAAGGVPIPARARSVAIALLLLLFGTIHLTQAPTITALCPDWLPLRGVVPYVTGVLQIAAASSLAVRPARLPRLAVAGLYLSWLPLVHTPRLLADPSDAGEWRFAAMALTLSGMLLMSERRFSDRRRFEEARA